MTSSESSTASASASASNPAPPHAGDAQCPVPHAAQQPLPPGHPAVATAPSSSLKPPTDPRCIFFRTQDDVQSASASGTNTPTSERSRAELLAAANINPLAEQEARTADPETTFVLGSRNSQLALVQASHVSHMLSQRYGTDSPSAPSSSNRPASFPITSMSTAGDHNLKSPLYVIGGEGKAIWTKELEVALKLGAIDAVVHCLKDVPTTIPDDFVIGAILEREDPRDALVVKAGLPYKTLDELPTGSVIGTSSVRRVAQLRRRYPGLVFSDVRGNLGTRISKLDAPQGPYTAIVLAAAGLLRINLGHRITAFLQKPVLLYSVGQGSLAIEVRKPKEGADPKTDRDARILEMVKTIGDWRATARQEAERALLKELEGGCSIPVGVETRFEDHEDVEGAGREQGDVVTGVEGEASAEGHAVTKTAARAVEALQSGKGAESPVPATKTAAPSLRRLATDRAAAEVQSNGSAADTKASSSANGSSASAPHPSPLDTLPSTSSYSSSPITQAHLPPPSPLTLTLTAIVVSLDGSRSCSTTHSASIPDISAARQLGIRVARELRDEKGAKAILEEVERHRHLAEEMDRKRREEAKKRRELHEGGTDAEQQERESRLKLDELLAKAGQESNGRARAGSSAAGEEHPTDEALRRLQELVPQANGGEMDRRGMPREDGQEKVWEV
ncbi:hypothetical protein BDZ90DRAFT_232212 [Jaminaea rosea]|uniref:hydroxymethylbilane synthase n=1 Tax=Jaminaea rosea TaxID=1569628 RepID=A0A316URB0_9BASI|nr:hypothetical protein BDZ90DRAFT_232212 [Jaminaea rosea]PWN27826.1 hypothetical protein BDZ90DRAFT_232212 [Jaminaea rosea]